MYIYTAIAVHYKHHHDRLAKREATRPKAAKDHRKYVNSSPIPSASYPFEFFAHANILIIVMREKNKLSIVLFFCSFSLTFFLFCLDLIL